MYRKIHSRKIRGLYNDFMKNLLILLLLIPMISFGEKSIVWYEIFGECYANNWGANRNYDGMSKKNYCHYMATENEKYVYMYPELFQKQPNNQNIPIQPPPCSIGLEGLPCVKGM